MTHTHHTVDYVELTTQDVASATAFYAAAFGWTSTAYGPGYAGLSVPGTDGETGGVAAGPTRPPLVILYSDDLDATRRAVVAAGGSAGAPYDFPGGRRFHFTDPAGNELAVWSEA